MKPRSQVALGMLAALLVGIGVRGALPNLAGRWAMVQVYPQTAVFPFAGEVTRTSYVVQWVEIEQDGATLTMRDTYCLTFVDDGTPLVTTEIPASFMTALRPLPRTATLSDQGDEIVFVQPPYLEVRGAVLENAESDALPIDPDDPRVFDQDGDGHPGMTVFVKILEIIEGQTYIVQRVRYALLGRVVEPDRIEGSIEWSDEQTVLEATNALLKVDTIGYPDPDPTKHIFIMIRMQEIQTCEWLGEHWWELLGFERLPGTKDDE
ncbi:hypothetical protein ACFLTM_03665 [Candidatus Bipolaricaulota bacterium]